MAKIIKRCNHCYMQPLVWNINRYASSKCSTYFDMDGEYYNFLRMRWLLIAYVFLRFSKTHNHVFRNISSTMHSQKKRLEGFQCQICWQLTFQLTEIPKLYTDFSRNTQHLLRFQPNDYFQSFPHTLKHTTKVCDSLRSIIATILAMTTSNQWTAAKFRPYKLRTSALRIIIKSKVCSQNSQELLERLQYLLSKLSLLRNYFYVADLFNTLNQSLPMWLNYMKCACFVVENIWKVDI